jgi:hypothetical protein
VDDISAVSAWLSQQPVPADAAAVSDSAIALPLECGSVAQARKAVRP